MRKLKYVLPLLFSVGILLAASPFKGNWKMNHAKSSATKGSVPKAEEMTIADEGDHLKVNIVGTNADGTPIAISYTIPVSGGAGQMQQSGSYKGVSARSIDDNTRDTSYSNDGKQLDAEHMVVAADGNTMTVTVKGVDGLNSERRSRAVGCGAHDRDGGTTYTASSLRSSICDDGVRNSGLGCPLTFMFLKTACGRHWREKMGRAARRAGARLGECLFAPSQCA